MYDCTFDLFLPRCVIFFILLDQECHIKIKAKCQFFGQSVTNDKRVIGWKPLLYTITSTLYSARHCSLITWYLLSLSYEEWYRVVSSIFRNFYTNRYRILLKVSVSNISGQWPQIRKLSKKYNTICSKICINSIWGAIQRQLVNCAIRLVRSLDCACNTNYCKSYCRIYCISLITFLFVAIGR